MTSKTSYRNVIVGASSRGTVCTSKPIPSHYRSMTVIATSGTGYLALSSYLRHSSDAPAYLSPLPRMSYARPTLERLYLLLLTGTGLLSDDSFQLIYQPIVLSPSGSALTYGSVHYVVELTGVRVVERRLLTGSLSGFKEHLPQPLHLRLDAVSEIIVLYRYGLVEPLLDALLQKRFLNLYFHLLTPSIFLPLFL
jgi:hypothetical protein